MPCRFSPEKLGIVASSTLAWLVLEVGLILLGFYLLNVTTDYSFIDIFAYCGYKYLSYVVLTPRCGVGSTF